MRHREHRKNRPDHKVVSPRRLRLLGAASVGALVAVVCMPLAASGAAAATRGVTAAVVPADSTTDPLPQVQVASDAATTQSMTTASTQAVSTGAPQPVPALYTPTEQVYANPSGDFTMTASALPMQVLQSGTWVPTDPTLATTSSGTLAPKAAYDPLSLSGGGTGALATMSTRGTTLTTSWPTALPTPTVAGATATYPEVMPGVDLVVTADDTGDISEVLVVKTATAAADPGLAAILQPTSAPGATLAADSAGNLTATTAHGVLMFSAPAPMMWDSATGADPVVSSADGPGTGANTAPVAVAVSASGVTFTPDQTMLTSSNTVFPAYVSAPQWHAHWANGPEQAFDEVQQGCPGKSNFDSTSYDPQGPGAGNNQYWGCFGIERAYYRLGLPLSQLANAQIISATLNARVSFAASKGASTETLDVYSTCGINGATTWNHQPCQDSTANPNYPNPLASKSVTTTSQFPGIALGFDVSAGLKAAVHHQWSTWTLEVANSDESDKTKLVRLAKNPNITVEYDHAPSTPSGMTATDGGANTGCVSAAPYPWMGKTASVNPPSLQARAADVDGDQLQFDFHYWSPQTGGSGDVYSTVAAGQLAGSKIPQAFVNSVATGDTVGWNVRAYDGHAYGPWSRSCYYQVDKTDPDEPGVTSSYYPQLNSGVTPVAAGTPGVFDIETPLGTATSMTFVYHLDGVPSAASPLSTEKVAATKLAVGTGYVWDATVTLAAPSPGPHDLHVYAKDQAGNSSGLMDYQFLANGDAHVSCSTLSSCFNNVITSPPANPAGGDGDGAGNSIASQDLAAAGWSGTSVTVDGATFTLPSYGTGLKDNLLAKGQTVSLGGVKGSAVVVLATGTYANTVSPPVDTTSVPATLAAPFMPQGTAMVGYRDATQNAVVFPSGTVNYATTGASPASYSIGVPDWAKGPAAPAVLTLPHTDTPSGAAAAPLHLYAFAIPVNPKIALASISLPDIAGAVTENGQNTWTPALHILGIAVRPAATADLPAGTASGSAWDAAWSSPPQGTYSPAAGSWAAQQTLRTALTPAVSGAGIRIRLSNAGGTAPLTIAAATIAVQSAAGSAAAAGAPTALTFGAKSSVTIPAGAEAWSDPLAMTVSAGQGLLVSESIGAKITVLPGHTWNSSATTTWLTPADGVDHAADTSATAFTASGSISGHWTNVLTDVAVSTANPVPAVAVIGDDLVNPSGSGMKAPAGGTHLADQLIPTQGAASVVDESIANNQLLNDATTTGGPALLSRVDRDVLDQPGIGTVIVNEGLNDLLAGTTAEDADPDTAVAGADGALQQLFGNFGITLIYTTPTPCGGYAPCTASVDAMRQNVAVYLDNHIFGFLADTSGAVGNSATAPPSLQSAYDAGDHVNLSGAGYLQLSGSVFSFWYTANQFS